MDSYVYRTLTFYLVHGLRRQQTRDYFNIIAYTILRGDVCRHPNWGGGALFVLPVLRPKRDTQYQKADQILKVDIILDVLSGSPGMAGKDVVATSGFIRPEVAASVLGPSLTRTLI